MLIVKSELTHYLLSRKIEEKHKMKKEKSSLINHQCIVKCDLCNADYIGYATRYLQQNIEEHITLVIGKHMKEVHGVALTDLAEVFSVLTKCRGKLDCLIQELPFIRERKPMLNSQSDSTRAKVFI